MRYMWLKEFNTYEGFCDLYFSKQCLSALVVAHWHLIVGNNTKLKTVLRADVPKAVNEYYSDSKYRISHS